MKFKKYEWNVFICHATEDKENIVDPFHAELTKHIKKIWYDKENIKDWDSIKTEVIKNVEKSRVLVVILSKALLQPKKEKNKKNLTTKKWPWIEIGKFLDNNNDDFFLPLLYDVTPYEFENFDVPAFIKEKNIPQLHLTNLKEKALNVISKVKKHKAQERKKSFFITTIFLMFVVSFITILVQPSENNLASHQISEPHIENKLILYPSLKKDSIKEEISSFPSSTSKPTKKKKNIIVKKDPFENDSIGSIFNTYSNDLTTVKITNVTLNPSSTMDWHDTIIARNGDVIAVRVSYHNTSEVTAKNTSIHIGPRYSSLVTSQKFTGNIKATNLAANCVKCNGSAFLNVEGEATVIKFIPGSIRWYPDTPLSDERIIFTPEEELQIFNAAGINLGDILPDISCPKYQTYCHQGTIVLQYIVQ